MKHSKRHFGFFAMLLALLGLGGCNQIDEEIDEGMKLMYGTPSVHYSIKGKVTDDSGKALKGIEVTVMGNYTENGKTTSRPIGDNCFSDTQGDYAKEHSFVVGFQSLTFHFKDIDGEANGGLFAEDSTTVNVIVKDVTNGSSFFKGKADVDVPTVKLKKSK